MSMGVISVYIYNMRYGNLTTEEILKAEKAKDDRIQSRNKGFSKMRERDQSRVQLSNGVFMEWHVEVEPPELKPGEVWVGPPDIPEGKFVLTIGKTKKLFDAEEFRRWLRWA